MIGKGNCKPSTMGITIGIDIGSSSFKMGYIDEFGVFQIIKNREGELTTPSVVYFAPDGTSVVGRDAQMYFMSKPDQTVRFISHQLGDIQYTININGNDYSMKDIASLILKKMIDDAEAYLLSEIDGVIISVPSWFGGNAKREIIDAAKSVILSNGNNLCVLSIIPNEVAIASSYKALCGGDINKTILVYDLGYGFDCAVLKIESCNDCSNIKILTGNGDPTIGGPVWDYDIAIHIILEKFGELMGIADPYDTLSHEDFQWLYDTAEQVKIKLSYLNSVVVSPCFNGYKAKIEITRKSFEDYTENRLNYTIHLVEEMLQKAKLSVSNDIDAIVLAGGGSKMPQVKKRLLHEYNKPIFASQMKFMALKGVASIGKGVISKRDIARWESLTKEILQESELPQESQLPPNIGRRMIYWD